MTFKESIITCIQFKYVDFKGRASRSEYWWFMLFAIILYIATSIVDVIIFGHQGIFYTIAALALLCPSLAVAIRRLHDIGKVGWWVLLAIIPIIGLALIYFFCQPSQPISNEYGEPPVT